jgi:hypothetical protein
MFRWRCEYLRTRTDPTFTVIAAKPASARRSLSGPHTVSAMSRSIGSGRSAVQDGPEFPRGELEAPTSPLCQPQGHHPDNVRVTPKLPTLRAAPFSDPKRRLCQKDLARRWGLSTRTLERWRMEGRGPPFMKLEGRVIYRAEDVEAFEIEHLHQSTGAAIGRHTSLLAGGEQP